jgi:hypothetical protein
METGPIMCSIRSIDRDLGVAPLEAGLTIALSPVQLAAILSGQAISASETTSNRLWGGLKLLGGSLEMVGAAALLLAPEPTLASKAGGVALAAHGSDTLSAGLWQVWTGQEQRSLTERGATELALRLGADPATAGNVGTAVDIAVPLAVAAGVGAARLISIRFGRISLAEHEASVGSRVGGHTIAKHVGKTDAELRARLVAEPRRQLVASFDSLPVAERVLYRGLRANRSAIETWARGARPRETREFFFNAEDAVGTVLVRATNQLQRSSKVRIVLKLQDYNGKLYYILTAFPDL